MSLSPTQLGFDNFAGQRWIYPNNMPIRPYQKQAVEKALFNNAMIVLPTGFGKTFIAAVVMYNFWRWYPQGKLIFVAPTRPLVAQQIIECKKISGIPSSECIELVGTIHSIKRADFWHSKRVFFATPQVIENDLESGILPAMEVRCIVIDEAHRAQGNYAYVNIVRLLQEQNKNGFRILALSATPGSDIERVKQVILNLFISEVMFRTEGALDLMSFRNEKVSKAWTVEITGKHKSMVDRYIEATKPVFKELYRASLIYSENIERTPAFALIKAKETAINAHSGKYKSRLTTLCIAGQSMAYNFNLLTVYGIRVFYASVIKNFSESRSMLRTFVGQNAAFNQILSDIQSMFGDDVEPNPRKLATADLLQGHPKMIALRDLLRRHFNPAREGYKPETRVIVFTKFKESVNDIVQTLKQADPVLFKPGVFVGQASMKQSDQLQMVKDFKEGNYNIMVATCVAEEGLDIGEVDLIICYDTTSSPISNTQRRGRTGRKRAGDIETLLTKGYEESKLKKAGQSRRQVEEQLYERSNYMTVRYRDAPRMVPSDVIPVCLEQVVSPVNDEEDEQPQPKRRRRQSKKDETESELDDKKTKKTTKEKKKCALDSDDDEYETLDMSSSSLVRIDDNIGQDDSPLTIDQSQSVADTQKTTISLISAGPSEDSQQELKCGLASSSSSQQPSSQKVAQCDSDIEWESDLEYDCV